MRNRLINLIVNYNATSKAGDNLLSLTLTANYHWRDVRFTCEFGMLSSGSTPLSSPDQLVALLDN